MDHLAHVLLKSANPAEPAKTSPETVWRLCLPVGREFTLAFMKYHENSVECERELAIRLPVLVTDCLGKFYPRINLATYFKLSSLNFMQTRTPHFSSSLPGRLPHGPTERGDPSPPHSLVPSPQPPSYHPDHQLHNPPQGACLLLSFPPSPIWPSARR